MTVVKLALVVVIAALVIVQVAESVNLNMAYALAGVWFGVGIALVQKLWRS